jgi:hypothetical protein
MCIPRHSSGLLVGIIINLININKSQVEVLNYEILLC